MAGALVHHLFERVAADSGERVAVLSADGSATYAEINGRADGIAGGLAGKGVEPGETVGLWFHPGIEYVAALLGVMKHGAIAVPLDPETPERRLERMLATVAPRVVLTGGTARRSAGGLDCTTCRVEAFSPGDGCSTNRSNPDGTAYLMFTSGSTGFPRAVAGRASSLGHFLDWEIREFGLDASCRTSLLAPLTFDVSLRDIFAPLLSGGVLCVPPRATSTNMPALVDWMARHAVNHVHSVPSLFRAVLNELQQNPDRVLPELRRILLAGEPLYAADVRQWRARMGSSVELVNLYGPTETTLAKAFHRIGAIPGTAGDVVPLGKPISETELLILQGDESCRQGVVGEICIRTPHCSNGYYDDRDATASRFVPNPIGSDPADIIYRTGDRGCLSPEGVVEFRGRVDDQVKLNGVRLELAEVEAHLRLHPEVREAVAAVHSNGAGLNQLAVYYTTSGSPTRDALREHLSGYLPRTMLPSFYERLDSLPLNRHGKVDRQALPRPRAPAGRDDAVYEAPSSDIETRLAGIWQRIFGLERISASASFFDLGGDSLKAIRVIGEVYREFGVELEIGAFFEYASIRALARAIEEAGHE